MDFNVNDFFLLEADDEAKKEEDEKKDKDDEKKEKESESKEDKKEDDDKSSDEDDSEYNDLMDDDNADSESSDDTDSDSSDDDEYNDLMDDDIGDLSADDDEPVADDSSDDSGDYNTLIVVKGGDEDGGASGSVYDALAKLGYLYVVISNNMKHIHLNCAGRKFDELHRQSEEYYYHFNGKADQYFELAAESPTVKLDNPTRSKEHVEDIDVESEENYTFETAISRMSNNFNKAIEYLKTTREKAGNDRTDIQSTLDEELTYLNKQYNFILRKKMINDDTATSDISESYNWLF
jgi:DNA-binding ferritin-like protein